MDQRDRGRTPDETAKTALTYSVSQLKSHRNSHCHGNGKGTYPATHAVTHLTTNRAQRTETWLIETNTLPVH